MRNLILEECILNLFTKIILDLNCEKAVGNIIIIEEFWFRILQIIFITYLIEIKLLMVTLNKN